MKVVEVVTWLVGAEGTGWGEYLFVENRQAVRSISRHASSVTGSVRAPKSASSFSASVRMRSCSGGRRRSQPVNRVVSS
jgi:hypothetical protein